MQFHSFARYATRNQMWPDFICTLVATALNEVQLVQVISREFAWIFFITNIPLAHTVPAMDEYFTNPNWRIQHEDAPGGEVSGRSEYCFVYLSIATCS